MAFDLEGKYIEESEIFEQAQTEPTETEEE